MRRTSPRPERRSAEQPAGFSREFPWALAVVLGVLPLALKLLGSVPGEPVAEDFDFLRRALLTSDRSLLDGGGSQSFWRPLSHQLYYLALGPLILRAPGVVAALHLALLAAGALLLYRALRPAWPGWAAAAAATFPLLAESTRTIVAWPTQFVDLGLFLFSTLAIHERARGRLATSLLALAAALLCKELAVVTGALLALWPDATPRRRRVEWALASAAVIAVWAALYLWVRASAGLTLPHQIESDPAVLTTPLVTKVWWGTWNSLRANLSLALAPGRWDGMAALAAAAILGAAAFLLARRDARRRLGDAAPWIGWGLGWFVLASAALAAIYPLWQPNRHHFGSVGLGIAAVALFRAAHPALVAGLVAARTALLLVAPMPEPLITRDAPDRGAFMDFERLTRLQRLMREIRTTLRAAHPELPAGATLVPHHLPLAAQYALGGSFALQVWYRDSTLRWEEFTAFSGGRAEPVAIVEFEPRPPQITLVDPAAMRELVEAVRLAEARRYAEALERLDAVERMPIRPESRVLLASVAGTRASALAALGRLEEAEESARRAITLHPRNPDGRFVLGTLAFAAGRLAEAEAHFDTLLLEPSPSDSIAVALRERVREARRAPR